MIIYDVVLMCTITLTNLQIMLKWIPLPVVKRSQVDSL